MHLDPATIGILVIVFGLAGLGCVVGVTWDERPKPPPGQ